MSTSASGNQSVGDELDDFWEEELQRRPEVRIINKYVAVMAYIRIGLKGVGALALLWATVVLLGGFVSDLKGVDFRNLTIVAFVQATGLSDAIGDVRFEFIGGWFLSLFWKINPLRKKHRHERRGRESQKDILVLKRIADITLIVIFFPVVYFPFAGPMLCIALSATRLAKQDYGIVGGNQDKANLKPALNLFYYVSLAHSAIYLFYLIIVSVVDEELAEIVSQQHGFSAEILHGYLQETKQMCAKNLASTESWNLIAYGAGLLDSQLPEDYVSGGRALTMLMDQDIPVPITWLLIRSPRQRIQKLISTLAWRSPAEREMRWLAARIVEHLAGHLSLAQFPGALECISSLLETSCCNNGDQEALHLPFEIGRSEQRKKTSFLNKLLAGKPQEDKHGNLKVPESPFRIMFGFSLELIHKIYGAPKNNDTLEQHSEQRENGEAIAEDLVLPGLRILEKLAHDRHNRTLICNTKDLLSKIVAPVSSDNLVQDIKRNAAWTKVVDGSLKVVSRLMGSLGSTREVMPSLFAGDENAANNLEAVLDMDMKSNSSIIELQMTAIEVLTNLVLHRPSSSATVMRRDKLIESAIHIFVTKDWMEDYLKHEKRKIDKPTTSHVENKMIKAKETASQFKEKAGEALAVLSSDSVAIKSFTGSEDFVHCLTALLDSSIKTMKCEISATDTVGVEINTGYRISAAVILKNMRNYANEATLSKVLEELLPIQAEGSSTPRCREHATGCIPSIGNDIENPSGGGQVDPSALQSRNHIQQCGERRLQAELLSLVAAIRASGNVDFPATLISMPQQDAQLETFVVRLKKEQCYTYGPFFYKTAYGRSICRGRVETWPSFQGNDKNSPNQISTRMSVGSSVSSESVALGFPLKKMVEDNMYATPACLAIQKLTCEMVIEFIPHDLRNAEVIDKHNIVGTLLKASKIMAGLESTMLFAGVDRDCHGVPLRPLSSDLAKQAEDILTQRKQVLGISTNAPASVP